ncbi:YrhB domain-containing protein [Kitasatospora sp. NPDC057015]|uniref:YrhB domain-containing protein n=1 Tax=Kitasatospora sp. NPDC057015 TaxID=3346001 RepID=UPI0036427B1C
MLTKDEATALVMEQLALVEDKYWLNRPERTRPDGPECLFAISHMDRVSFGWVAYWTLREAVEGRTTRPRLGGNGPFLVDRENGTVHQVGTGRSPRHYVAEYERTRAAG